MANSAPPPTILGPQGPDVVLDDDDSPEVDVPVERPAPDESAPPEETVDLTFGGAPLFFFTSEGCRSFGVPALPGRLVTFLKPLGAKRRGYISGGISQPPIQPSAMQPFIGLFQSRESHNDPPPAIYFSQPGVWVVIGVSASGKSVLINGLASSLRSRRVPVAHYQVGEPDADVFHLGDADTYAALLNVAARRPPGSVVIVDSIATLGDAGGAASRGGISRESISQYIELMTAATRYAGNVAVLAMNALTDDADALRSLAEQIKGKAAGVITLGPGAHSTMYISAPDNGEKTPVADITMTISDRPRREPTQISVRVKYKSAKPSALPSDWASLIINHRGTP